MPDILFSSRSYLVTFNFQPENNTLLKKFAETSNFGLISATNTDELELILSRVKFFMGIFLNFQNLHSNEIQRILILLNRLSFSCQIFYSPEQSSIQNSRNHILRQGPITYSLLNDCCGDQLKRLEPKGLKKLVEYSTNQIFPDFFPSFKDSFSTVETIQGQFDKMIIYYTVTGNLIGRCTVRFAVEKLMKKCIMHSEDQLVSTVKECVNQMMGIISHNLGKINTFPKIGLPITFDLRKIPHVSSSSYFPDVNIADPQRIFVLTLGYLQMVDQPAFNLSAINFDSPGGEIEFL